MQVSGEGTGMVPWRFLLLLGASLAVGASPSLGLSLYAVIPEEGTLGGQLWLVDPVNGNQLIGRPVTQGLEGLAADSSGALYASTFVTGGGSSLLRIDPDDGSLLGSIPILDSLGSTMAVTDLAMQPGTDVLYAATINVDGIHALLYTIDQATGVASLVGDTGLLTLGDGAIGFAPDGTLYYADFAWGFETLFLHRLDPVTGQHIGAGVAYNAGSGSLAVGPDGMIYGTAGLCCNSTIWKSDPNVANSAVSYASLVGVGSIGDLVFVPEPSTVVLVAITSPLLVALRRRSML